MQKRMKMIVINHIQSLIVWIATKKNNYFRFNYFLYVRSG